MVRRRPKVHSGARAVEQTEWAWGQGGERRSRGSSLGPLSRRGPGSKPAVSDRPASHAECAQRVALQPPSPRPDSPLYNRTPPKSRKRTRCKRARIEERCPQVSPGPSHPAVPMDLAASSRPGQPRPPPLPCPTWTPPPSGPAPPGRRTTRSASRPARRTNRRSSGRPRSVRPRAGSPPASGGDASPAERAVSGLGRPRPSTALPPGPGGRAGKLTWSRYPSRWHWRQSLQAKGTQSR